jgi:hypothetical protein
VKLETQGGARNTKRRNNSRNRREGGKRLKRRIMDLDQWLEKVKGGNHLLEDELKQLCEYVSFFLFLPPPLFASHLVLHLPFVVTSIGCEAFFLLPGLNLPLQNAPLANGYIYKELWDAVFLRVVFCRYL